MGKSCDLPLGKDGKPSKLYNELHRRLVNHDLANYIYSCYLQEGVAEKMKDLNYKENSQGEHSVDDVYKFFEVPKIISEYGSTTDIQTKIGARKDGDLVDFSNAKDALEMADKANTDFSGITAYVVRKGDIFNVQVVPRNGKSQFRIPEIRKNLAIWKALETAFDKIGIDINNSDLDKKIANANNSENFLTYLELLKESSNNRALSQKDIKTLLEINKGISSVKGKIERLNSAFNTQSTDALVSGIYNALSGNATPGNITLINSLLDECKRFKGLDIDALKTKVGEIKAKIKESSKEVGIQETYNELDEKYNIGTRQVEDDISKSISSLEGAIARAIMTLDVQINSLRRDHGDTPESRKLKELKKQLLKELGAKKYSAGLLSFLRETMGILDNLKGLFAEAYAATDPSLESVAKRAKALMQIKDLYSAYEEVVGALANSDQLIINADIDIEDLNKIKEQAGNILEVMSKYKLSFEELQRKTIIDNMVAYLGEETSAGVSVINLVGMATADSSVMDRWLYSSSRLSNPLLAVAGTIIRDAQSERTKIINEFALRIRRATNKLYKEHSNTKFMYDEDGHIISDIDWDSYEKARAIATKRLKSAGLKGVSLSEALTDWELANTEERVVDTTNGRAERVPNGRYRKAMPQLTEAQMEYYNTMMQIKGEIGSLLPHWAQQQFLPPQKRRDTLDALKDSKGNPKMIAKAIYNWIKDWFTIREDDTQSTRSGQFNGEQAAIGRGDFEGKMARSIPVYYVNRIKDQVELLKDFSAGIQALAATAANFHCMNQVSDTVELIADFIKEQKVGPKKGNVVQQTKDEEVAVFRRLYKKAVASDSVAIIEGVISQHIYGEKMKDYNKFTKLGMSLLKYTSLRALTVNFKGMFNNWFVGQIQMLIEAGGAEFYNLADWSWAQAHVFGDNTLSVPRRLADWVGNKANSMAVLLAERFDPLNEQYQESANTRYYKGPLMHLLSKDLSFIGYGAGEHLLHFTNMYAVLHHQKVRIDGKDARLTDALYKTNKKDGNSELAVKENTLYQNDEGEWVPVDDTYLDKVKGIIRYVNQTTHGSMNEEDRGLMHQYLLGKFIANLRQWMVEHFSRRWRDEHWDGSLQQWVKGYHRDFLEFSWNLIKDISRFRMTAMANWNTLEKHQKANVRRSLMEISILGALYALVFALGSESDHKDEFWRRFFIYQAKRALMEVDAFMPQGILGEFWNLLNSPMPALNTVKSILYPITGWRDMGEDIKSGPDKGKNKWLRNMVKYFVPFYYQIQQFKNMGHDDSFFKNFATQGI